MAILHKLLLDSEFFQPILYLTGQHFELINDALEVFDLVPDVVNEINLSNNDLILKTSEILKDLQQYVNKNRPDIIIVQGDTLSAYCGAYTAFLNGIPVFHVEAGMRTFDIQNPFPEELYRQFIDKVSEGCFAPTEVQKQNLIKEGISLEKIVITGNTGIDALMYIYKKHLNNEFPTATKANLILNQFKQSSIPIILLTLHRRENQDTIAPQVLQQLNQLAMDNKVQVIFPMHPTPKVLSLLNNEELSENIKCTDALDYHDFIKLMSECDLVITDSGGVQEEAPYLGKPLMLVRTKTERVKVIDGYQFKMYNEKSFEKDIFNLLSIKAVKKKPYGDGNTSQQIINHLRDIYC